MEGQAQHAILPTLGMDGLRELQHRALRAGLRVDPGHLRATFLGGPEETIRPPGNLIGIVQTGGHDPLGELSRILRT
jgi:hypothetical protein